MTGSAMCDGFGPGRINMPDTSITVPKYVNTVTLEYVLDNTSNITVTSPVTIKGKKYYVGYKSSSPYFLYQNTSSTDTTKKTQTVSGSTTLDPINIGSFGISKTGYEFAGWYNTTTKAIMN
jgi:hypothetical protein